MQFLVDSDSSTCIVVDLSLMLEYDVLLPRSGVPSLLLLLCPVDVLSLMDCDAFSLAFFDLLRDRVEVLFALLGDWFLLPMLVVL